MVCDCVYWFLPLFAYPPSLLPCHSLAQNFIDAVAAAELGALIMATSTLTQLDLSRTGMTNSCVFAFAKSMAFNRSITELDLRGNSIRYDNNTNTTRAHRVFCTHAVAPFARPVPLFVRRRCAFGPVLFSTRHR